MYPEDAPSAVAPRISYLARIRYAPHAAVVLRIFVPLLMRLILAGFGKMLFNTGQQFFTLVRTAVTVEVIAPVYKRGVPRRALTTFTTITNSFDHLVLILTAWRLAAAFVKRAVCALAAELALFAFWPRSIEAEAFKIRHFNVPPSLRL